MQELHVLTAGDIESVDVMQLVHPIADVMQLVHRSA